MIGSERPEIREQEQGHGIVRFAEVSFRKRVWAVAAMALVSASLAQTVQAQASGTSVQTAPPDAPGAATAATAPLNNHATNLPFDEMLHRSFNPLDAYRGKTVPPPSLDNSMRLNSLVKDGKLYLTLQNAIDLALETISTW